MMKTIFYSRIALIALLSVTLLSFNSFAQTNKEWSKKSAGKWYKQWKKNHKGLHPGTIKDVQEFAKQYNANTERWDKAFAFLLRSDLGTLAPGKYEVDGEYAFATVSEGTGRDYEPARWESHKAVADIHYLISGGEMVGLAPVATATLTKPFSDTSDTALYTTEGQPYPYSQNSFFIIFPSEAHQPGIKSPASEQYKKVVVKVKVI
jgi:biofilm protein TabA